MTTIAFDGTTIASDTRMGSDNNNDMTPRQKFVVEGDVIYTASGLAAALYPFIDWHKAGADPKDFPSFPNDVTLWSITRDGIAEYFKDTPWPVRHTVYPLALGTGCEYALGAMTAGASPEEAVRIAMKWDANTAGEVRTARVPWEVPHAIRTHPLVPKGTNLIRPAN